MHYYDQLTIHQKISLKALITSSKERRCIGVDFEWLNALHGLALFYTWPSVIEYYFSQELNDLKSRDKTQRGQWA